MGTYYSATTIIGFKVSTTDCSEHYTEQSCNHNAPAGMRFCPDCGKKVETRKSSRLKKEYWNFLDDFAYRLRRPWVFQTHYDGDGDCFWIGYGSTAQPAETSRVEPKPYEGIKAEIVTMMKPFTSTGLFVLDDDEFAIWTIHAGH